MPHRQLDDLQVERVQEALKNADLPLMDDDASESEDEDFTPLYGGQKKQTWQEAVFPKGAYGWSMCAVQLFILCVFSVTTAHGATDNDAGDRALMSGLMVFVYSVICVLGVLITYLIRFVVVVRFLRPMVDPKINLVLDVFDPCFSDVAWTAVALFVVPAIFSVEEAALGWGGKVYLIPKIYEGLQTVQVLLLFWALKNLCRSLIVFKFSLRFSMNWNRELVRYLSLYSTLRKLNLVWSTVTHEYRKSPGASEGHGAIFTDVARPEIVVPSDSMTCAGKLSRAKAKCCGGCGRRPQGSVATNVTDLPPNEVYPDWLKYKNIKQTERSQLRNMIALTRVHADTFTVFPGGQKKPIRSKRDVPVASMLLMADFNTMESILETGHNRETIVEPSEPMENSEAPLADFKRALSRVEAKNSGSLSRAPDEDGGVLSFRTHQRQRPTVHRASSGEAATPAAAPFSEDLSEQPAGANSSSCYSSDGSSSESPSRHEDVEAALPHPEFAEDARHMADPDHSWRPHLRLGRHARPKKAPAVGKRRFSRPDVATQQSGAKLLSKALDNLVAQEEKKQNRIEADSTKVQRRTLESFLRSGESKMFFDLVDPSLDGRIGFVAMRRCLQEGLKMCKTISKTQESHLSTMLVFSNMVDVILLVAFGMIFLYTLGVTLDMLVVSGAAVISSISISLSVLYSSYLQSVLLICFINPYGIGDRLYIDGQINVVKEMTTFYTLCTNIMDRPVIWPHHILLNKVIMNGSRSRVSTFEIMFQIASDTHDAKVNALHKVILAYIKARPSEWVLKEFFFMLDDVQPNHYLSVLIYATYNESWHYWMKIFTAKSELMKHIIKWINTLEISYHMPTQPLTMKALMDDAMRMKTD